ncbi:MAG: phosphoenolpyruvate synthase, partial [Parcubacteria group bacterium]|nr:phosphoenolpyruvate synthase [Parcubacteria group bacterium]
MNKFTLPFGKINKKSIAQAGGKGASLGEMQNNGFPIPSGFVVLASAFEKYLEETDLNVEIESALKGVNSKDMKSVENASEIINHLIKRTPIESSIEKEILIEFNKLGAKFVAVRSSATAEDSKIDSWAGELESYLNTTEKSLMENVKKCWMSLFTPRAIFYRFARKLEKQAISVAVVIQEMVESEISGVAFSVHPVTQDYNQMIIEAGWGLGEAIVLGKITPDSYVVNKKSEEIIDINISEQEKMVVKKGTNGDIKDISVPNNKKDK